MKKVDGSSRVLLLVTLSFFMMILCYLYHNYSVYKSIRVVVDDTASIEYGSANYDINKIVKEVEGDIVSIKKDVDINTLGEQEVVLEVKKDNIIKEVPIIVNVVDTVAPVIKIDKDAVSITEGDSFDINSNILSVNDTIDGDLSLVDNVQDSNLGYYSVSHDDLTQVGSHEVTVTAVDKSGNKSVSNFILNVKAKPVVNSTVTARVSSNVDVPDNVSGNEIVKIAYSYLGYPYQSGANGPSAFDCSGFVQYVYSRVGKSVSRSASTQINDGVGISYSDVQPGDILSWGYSNGVVTHSALYVGNGLMIHAANPSQGVILSNVSKWLSGSNTTILSVRRIG